MSSVRTAIISDVHIPLQHQSSYRAFFEWLEVSSVDHLVLLGDMVDLAGIGRFEKHGDEILPADEIKALVAEINKLSRFAKRVTYSMGNHEQRYDRFIRGANPHMVKGLKGLTFRDQCTAMGLHPSVVWHEESVAVGPLKVGNFILRHGHVGSGRFGSGINPAHTALKKTYGYNLIEGHHHRADYATATAFGKLVTCIANPCLASNQDYAGVNANWQRGFTVLEQDSKRPDVATPYLVVMDDGVFSWGGRTFGLKKRGTASRRRAA